MSAPDVVAAFSQSYREARDRFLAAASSVKLEVEHHVHPTVRGAEGEELACDIALLGDPAAPALVYLLSGTHGVEGFSGSSSNATCTPDPQKPSTPCVPDRR